MYESVPEGPTTFEECVAAGYPVEESYPARCSAPEKMFTEDIGNEQERKNIVRISYPRPNATITSPLSLSGEARGTWYFEASFPIELHDEEGNLIVQHFAEAQGEWMTESFVPFKGTLIFEKPKGTRGTLILRKDNPSGLPENDSSLIVPVRF